MKRHFDTIIIGAGIVGLAIARAIAPHQRVAVLEAATEIGEGNSFRNSAVIHAGIYYPPTSLKTKFCIRGQALLYDYCNANNIPYKKIGKLIVATQESDIPKLERLKANADACGASDIELVDEAAAKKLENNLACKAALYSKSTGIVAGKQLLYTLQHETQTKGVRLHLGRPFVQAEIETNGFKVVVGESEQENFACSNLINAAGLWAPSIAKKILGLPIETIPEGLFAKGNYFRLKAGQPFSHLIYPIPETTAGLGIHATLTLEETTLFGPDVEWVDSIRYTADMSRLPLFLDAIKQYYPNVERHNLEPAFAGIRPKIKVGGSIYNDFLIQDNAMHGVSGLINLYGIESPGLTAALAIADYIAPYLNM